MKNMLFKIMETYTNLYIYIYKKKYKLFTLYDFFFTSNHFALFHQCGMDGFLEILCSNPRIDLLYV